MLILRSLIAAVFTMLLLAMVASAQVITDSEVGLPMVTTDSYAETVPPGTYRQIPFTVDPGAQGGDVFHVVTTNPNATVSLIIPGGTEITSANAESLGYSYLTFQNDQPAGVMPSIADSAGTHTFISIPAQSAAGSYSIKIVAPAGTEDTAVLAQYVSSSPVRVGLVTDSEWYRVGQTIVITAVVLNDDTPITNASVTVAVDDTLGDATPPVNITLQDSGAHDLQTGDGIYTGTFVPTRSGDYTAAARITGVGPGGANFSRLTGSTFHVTEPLATFVSFSDTGIDDNADESLDRIVVTSNVSVQAAGTYDFSLSLVASNGNVIKSQSSATLATGSQQISVSFSAANVLGLGVDGPYAMKDALLTFHGTTNEVADYQADVGNTAAYTLPSLDRPPIFFTSTRTAAGVDTNGNGKFDLLRVRALVSVKREGFYEWSGVLADSAGTEIGFASSNGSFNVGGNMVTLDFDGSLIGQHGVNGPYSVKSVLLFGAGDSTIVDHLMDTQAFSYKEFESSDNLNRGALSVQETSGDGDGVIEPGENASLRVQLLNLGGTTLTGVNATLSTATPNVTITSAQSTYPDLPASGNGLNATPFAFGVASNFLCGDFIDFKLTIHTDGDGGIPSVINFSIQVGSPGGISTFNYSGPAVAIPDADTTGVNIPLVVSGFSGKLSDLNFRFGGSACTADPGATTVGLDHTYVGDLVIRLTSPHGTTVKLMNAAGLGGPTPGNNLCNLVLDDEGGGASIQDISPDVEPYSGTFRPTELLSAFKGEDPNGTWILNVADTVGEDTGNVRDFSLLLSGYECSTSVAPILADDFNDDFLDTTKWTANDLFSGFIDLSLPLAETGQHIEIGPLLQNASGSHYRGIRSVNSYDFTGGYAQVELVQAPSSTTTADAMFTVGYSVDNYYRLYVNAGNLIGLKKINGVKTTLFTLPYDSSAHGFLRIRHDRAANRIVFETTGRAGRGLAPWTERYNEPWNSSVELSATQFEVKGGTFQAETNAPGTVIFDNFQFGIYNALPDTPSVAAICPASGLPAGGTQVTIQGTGFVSGATVRFGGVAATNVVVASATTITATAPAHAAGAVDVEVTNANGQSGMLANGFTYVSPAAGVVLADSFDDNCLDTSKWTATDLFSGFTDLSVPIAQTSQRLEIGPLLLNASGSHYRGIRSVNSYDFTGASTYVELVQPASSASTADAMFTVGYSVDNYYRLYVNAGNLIGLKKVNGTKTTLFTLAYNATNHRFLRIRHDSATNSIVFETAPSSGGVPGTWTQRYSATWDSTVDLSAILFELKGGTFQSESNAPGKVIFDNFRAYR